MADASQRPEGLIYLDYAATTPVDGRVAHSMFEHLTREGEFANPSSGHLPGLRAREAVERAREAVAEGFGADPQDIVWTSGATEATNLALKGAVAAAGGKGHIVTCTTEHPATLDVCAALEREGVAVTRLAPQPNGHLDPQRVAESLTPDTVMVTLMHVNNELGVVHDLAAIGALTRERGILFHVDASQSLGKVPIDVRAMHIDLLSCTAHKIYGPKGIGALYVRSNPPVRLDPIAHGGGQERGLRPGTLPTHQIVGMGEAVRLGVAELAADDARVRSLRERLWERLGELDNVHLNNPDEPSVAGILSVSFEGVSAEDVMLEVPRLAVSAGSACASGSQHASHVLQAVGLSDERAHGTLRISLGRFSTADEVDAAARELTRAVELLRESV